MKLLDSFLQDLYSRGLQLEASCRAARNLPQYQYFTVPIYKFCVEKLGPVAATGVAFLAADLVLHQLIPDTLMCLGSQLVPDDTRNSYWYQTVGVENYCDFQYQPALTFLWVGCYGVPVMYAKYKKAKEAAWY
jgi:hypothetical protein